MVFYGVPIHATIIELKRNIGTRVLYHQCHSLRLCWNTSESLVYNPDFDLNIWWEKEWLPKYPLAAVSTNVVPIGDQSSIDDETKFWQNTDATGKSRLLVDKIFHNMMLVLNPLKQLKHSYKIII